MYHIAFTQQPRGVGQVQALGSVKKHYFCECESILHPFQAVASVEDDGRQENIEEDLRVKGHLSHTQKRVEGNF